jgi:Fe-S cluster assembly protein SufD
MKHASIRQDLLADVVGRLPDNGLRAIRAAALEAFSATGLPGPANEDWRYTNLQPVVELSNTWLAGPSAGHAQLESKQPRMPQQALETAVGASWLRCLNGRLIDNPSPGHKSDEMQISAVSAESAGDSANRVSGLAMSEGILSLNAALMQDIIRIRVPENVTVAQPLGLLLATDAANNSSVAMSRFVLEIGRNSHLDVIEDHVSISNAASFSNVVVEVKIARGASVNFLRVQECGDAQLLTGNLLVTIGQDGSFNYTSVDLGGALVRNDVNVQMEAPGAEMRASGLYLATDTQHIENHVRVDHRVGPARSRCEFRGIIHGRARCVFNSKAIVHSGADGTDAEQSNHNLLLSDKAEIDTKPELEIYADDVKCAHGATVGQLDKAALFYLRSRGIDEDSATRLLTRAFAASVVSSLSVPAASDYVAQVIERSLDTFIGDVT